jgi:DNA-binding PadR family transcriptional regulator
MRSVIWPAPQNEVYRILARLKSEGLISEKELGPRGRKTYAITRSGRTELAEWIAAPTDYTLRYDPVLKAGFLAGVSPKIRRERIEADLAFFSEQLSILRRIERERAASDKPDPRADVRTMAIGFYSAMAEWCRNAVKE